ncbi:hypothetical protein JCM8547_006114 [Rhodosporidiobolus lusitaniae]
MAPKPDLDDCPAPPTSQSRSPDPTPSSSIFHDLNFHPYYPETWLPSPSLPPPDDPPHSVLTGANGFNISFSRKQIGGAHIAMLDQTNRVLAVNKDHLPPRNVGDPFVVLEGGHHRYLDMVEAVQPLIAFNAFGTNDWRYSGEVKLARRVQHRAEDFRKMSPAQLDRWRELLQFGFERIRMCSRLRKAAETVESALDYLLASNNY